MNAIVTILIVCTLFLSLYQPIEKRPWLDNAIVLRGFAVSKVSRRRFPFYPTFTTDLYR